MYRITILIISFFVLLLRVHSQCGSDGYSIQFGTSGIDQGHSIAVHQNALFTLSVSSGVGQGLGTECLLTRHNLQGAIEWSIRIGGPGIHEGNNAVLASTANGDLLVAGYFRTGSSAPRQAFLMRLDNSGTILWQKMLTSATGDGDTPRDMLELSDGSIVLVGTSNTFTFGTSDAFIQRYTSTGQLMWGLHKGGGSNEHFYSVVESSDGTIVCAGNNQSAANQSYGAWLVEFDLNGMVLNERIYDSPGLDSFLGLVVAPQGGYYATIQSNYSGNADIGIMRIESNLNSDWCRYVPFPGTDWPVDAWVQPNGNPLLVCVSAQIGPASSNNIVNMEFSQSGEVLAVNALGYSDNDGAQLLSRISDRDSNGNLYVCGYTNVAGQMDIALHKLDACGASPCTESLMIPSSPLPYSQFNASTGTANYPAYANASFATSDAAPNLVNSEVLCATACSGSIALADDTACQGTVFSLAPTLNGTDTGTISWWVNNILTFTGPELELELLETGTYIITAELAADNGCTFSATSELAVLPLPALPEAGDISSCTEVELGEVIPGATWLNAQGDPVQYASQSGIYTATASNSCGTDSTELVITIFNTLIVLEVSNLISCLDSTATISAGPASEILDLSWYNPDLEQIGSGSQIEVSMAGSYLATGTTMQGCPFSLEAEVVGSMDSIPAPLTSLSGSLTCSEGSITLLVENESIYDSISVLLPNGSMSDLDDGQMVVDAPGQYLVTGQNGFCNAVSAVYVPSPSWPIGFFNILPFEELNCIQDEVNLLASPIDTNYGYAWSDGQGNAMGTGPGITVNAPDICVLEVTGTFESCYFADTVMVTADYILPELAISPSSYSIYCEGDQATLQLETNIENASIAWYLDTQPLPETDEILSIGSPGTYVAVVTNNTNGCSSEYGIAIQDSTGSLPDVSQLRFPNIFSPNQDNTNEKWKPVHSDPSVALVPSYFSSWDLSIYNRWGTLLYSEPSSQSGILDGWDGSGLPEGVYYYHLAMSGACDQDDLIVREGYIHIVR